MLAMSDHAQLRVAQRSLPSQAIEYIVEHGQSFHRAGVLFYFLRSRDVPVYDRCNENITRLVGTAVVLSKDRQTVITIWRNSQRGLKHIKRKPRYSTSSPHYISLASLG